ncbi:MAG: HAMP domain-containing histidine kinase [Anaerolineae bacterium]|nr:HAMP domain-containing histidine kinase [Anaerolineae bacterium]
MQRRFDRSHTAELLLKAHEALLLAKNEDEILAAVALVLDLECVLRLIYLRREGDQHTLEQIRIVASWKESQVWRDDPMLNAAATDTVLAHIVREADKLAENSWLLTDLQKAYTLPDSTFSNKVRGFAFVKLYRADPIQGHIWDAAICATWEDCRDFEDEERYILEVVSQTAAAVVANRKLYIQAVENVGRLKEIDRLKTQFLYTVSHELRTPLTGIITIADTLLHTTREQLNADIVDDVAWILKSGNHLLQLINDILDLAKIEAGQLQLYPKMVDVSELIRDVVQYAKPLMLKKGLNLETAIAPEVTTVWADPQRLYQVLLNLVSNAVKFTERGTIWINVYREHDTLMFAIRDEGIGIQHDYLDTIFEPFQQIDSALNRKVGGTGLGLPICRRLMDLHHGKIQVVSELNKGSTFFVQLPTKGHTR